MTLSALRHLIFDNLLLKIISIIIAFLLWGFLLLEKRSEIALTIPIRVENVPANMVLTELPPGDLRVVVRGRRTQLGAMNERVVPYTLDLTDVKAGVSAFDVISAKIVVPRGTQIVHVSPAQFTIKVSPVISKTLPVMLRFAGELPQGYRLLSARVTPQVIDIEGAKEEIERLKSIDTEPIDLSPVRGDVQLEVDLSVERLHVRELTTHAVEVSLDIDEVQSERTIENVSVTAPVGWRLGSTKMVSVTLRGPAGLLNQLDTSTLRAVAEPKAKGRQKVRAPVRVAAPEHVTVTRIVPPYVEVSP